MRSEGSRCQWGGCFWWAAARIGASAAEWLSLQARDHFISETGTGSVALVVETLGVENPPRATLSTITRSTDDSTIFRRLYSSFSKLRPTGHLPVPHDTHPSPTLTYSPYQVTPIKGLIRWMHDSRSIPSLSLKLAPRESTNRGKTKEKVFLNVKRPFIKMRAYQSTLILCVDRFLLYSSEGERCSKEAQGEMLIVGSRAPTWRANGHNYLDSQKRP